LIVSSIKDLVNHQPTLTAALPGDLHYGKAAGDTARPFGSLTVVELDSEYNSGGCRLVNYVVTLRLYGGQRARTVGELMQDFGSLLNNLHRLGPRALATIPEELGDLVMMIPTGGPMEDDDSREYGKDCIVAQQKWLVRMNESEKTLPQ